MYRFPLGLSPMRMNQPGFSGGCQREAVYGRPQREAVYGRPQREAVYGCPQKEGVYGCPQREAVYGRPQREAKPGGRTALPAVKCSATGDIILPNHTKQGDTYNIASISLDTANCCSFLVQLNFSCNICMTNASLHLRFQIFKQGICSLKAVPVGPGFHYFREDLSTESNAVTFSACDYDSSKSPHLNYSVYVEVMGGETVGTTAITNPVLIAAITKL